MTLHATREGTQITVHGNTGVNIDVKASQVQHVGITEHYQHVKHFHAQLGSLIADAEAEKAAEPE